MPLYPEFPQGVLTPGFSDFDRPLGNSPRQRPNIDFGNTAPAAMDSSQIAAAIGPTETPEVRRPGFFGRIRQQPGGSRALIALGASLLSNQNFFEGLGQGAMAYQGVLDQEQEALRPQLTRDGQFQYRRNPETGELEMTRTVAADFEEAQNTSRLQNAMLIAGIRDRGDTERLQTTMGYRDDWERMDDGTRRYEIDKRDDWNQRDNETDLEIARIHGENAWREAQLRVGSANGGPPPAGVATQITDLTKTRDAQVNAATQIMPVIDAITNGHLSFSLPNNLRHKAAIATGIGGNEETVWYSQYQTTLESLRNALLVTNTGVQTDGDAQRAMNELISGSGNTETVLANLRKIVNSLTTRQQQAQARIDELARQYGADVSNTSPGSGRSAPAQTQRSTGSSNGVRWRVVQ